MEEPQIITAIGAPLPSPARESEPDRSPLRVALVQQRFHEDPAEHQAALAHAVALAAQQGARIVCLQELTLSPYIAIKPDDREAAALRKEPLEDGPTLEFARR